MAHRKPSLIKRTAEKAGLPVASQANLAISGFLSNKKTQIHNVVRPLIQLGKYTCWVNAIVTDFNIILKVSGVKDTANYLRERGVKLAQDIYEDVNRLYHLIIGADYLARFLKMLIRREWFP